MAYYFRTRGPRWTPADRRRVTNYLDRLDNQTRVREGSLNEDAIETMCESEIARIVGLEKALERSEGALPRTPWMSDVERNTERAADRMLKHGNYEETQRSMTELASKLFGGAS